MKGCFTDTGCNNTECVDNSNPKKVNFCCCTGHMCNSQFKLVATTTKAPEIEGLAPPPKVISMGLMMLLIGCGVIFVISVLFAGAYFWKNKKNAMFNEIPTVVHDFSNQLSDCIITFNFQSWNRMIRKCMERTKHSWSIGRFN